METQFTKVPHIRLTVVPQKTEMFALMLQAGIKMPVAAGCSIGEFLESLPGFTSEYITDEVQTIFLNGTATDDMETELTGENPILAISAAMPGLAGAIFRRNSLHAALRTVKDRSEENSQDQKTTVTLKLFNAIARDRGIRLLNEGVVIESKSIQTFLETRSTLIQYITTITSQDEPITLSVLAELLDSHPEVYLELAA